jgi:hypothetical protein
MNRMSEVIGYFKETPFIKKRHATINICQKRGDWKSGFILRERNRAAKPSGPDRTNCTKSNQVAGVAGHPKNGKTALLERLYNVLFQRGMTPPQESTTKLVIPFYLRIAEQKISPKDFAEKYCGIPDDLFNQVVQTRFEYEIENIKNEDTAADIKRQNKEQQESVSQELIARNKGYFLEYMITRILKYDTQSTPSHSSTVPPLQQLVRNAPKQADFTPYETVGEYHFNLPDGHHRQFDVVAKAVDIDQPSLVVECKFWEKPVDRQAIEYFAQKVQDLKQQIPHLIPIFYSVSGFSQPALDALKTHHIAWSEPRSLSSFRRLCGHCRHN